MQLYQQRESIHFEVANPTSDQVIATVTRGPSKARFAINRAIMTFVQQFETPCTTDEAIRRYCKQERIQLTDARQRDLRAFARQIAATLLLNPIHTNAETAEQSIAPLGFEHRRTFKDKRFDAVCLVNTPDGLQVIKNIKEQVVTQSARRDILRDLENEFRVLTRLDGVSGVVAARTFCATSPAYFAMDYVCGDRLDKYVRSQPLCLLQRLDMAMQLLRLFAEIHDAGVLHGDVHLGNFMCSPTRQITVIDFGCASMQDSDYRPSGGATPHFAPPERASESWTRVCHSQPTRASECYQLGIVIAYVMTGTLPFRGKTYRELHRAIMSAEYRLPTTTPDGQPIPPALHNLIGDMLQRNPDDRPSDLMRLAHQFQSYANQESAHVI
ncbi:hypothetical protein GCM10008090_20100 [Arenicella chitinivorans]|uniref:Protein kinase domain-containing protein n=1 Tax=Arenicella chitinivorans TaxID=1329800 RepID=A0A918RTJ2_9GAMM|nr:protein kinase [Arenicella chitinivorans]GHA10467.1 hypothetical protein GCM10008090_20100 [Arenicella chitinivorans]